jgi:NTP pyrophosphatase (non-canonical NTP hydrolase)
MEEQISWLGYQAFVVSTKRYSENFRLFYPVLGLASEAGEVAGKLKKILRDGDGEITQEQAAKLFDELSDVLWYVTCCVDDLGLNIQELAQYNVDKLSARVERGTIHGDGDNR